MAVVKNKKKTNDQIELSDGFHTAILQLRELVKRYDKLTTTQQTALRNTIYRQNGDFGKVMMKNLVPEFSANERKLSGK